MKIYNKQGEQMTRILVVDDEELGRKAMKKIFAGYGQCTSVSNGKDAVNVYRTALDEKKPFNLIILDISLEDISGLEVLKRIKEIENIENIGKEQQTTIVMATSHSEKETVVNCLQAGCKGYFIKPLKPEPVAKRLAELGFKPLTT